MILAYGPYFHYPYECQFTIQRSPLVDDRRTVYGYTERWDITGELRAASNAEIEYKIAALKAAYTVQGLDLRLFRSVNGAISTPVAGHAMLSDAVRGGVRIVSGPNFPIGKGAELGLWRTYSVALEGDYIDPSASNLSNFWEELEFMGNGSGIWAYIPVINGLWPKQQTSTHSTFRAVQRGEAVGRFTYPYEFVPAPLWPSAHQGWNVRVKKGKPIRYNGALQDFPLTWEYQFEANTPMVSNPHAY